MCFHSYVFLQINISVHFYGQMFFSSCTIWVYWKLVNVSPGSGRAPKGCQTGVGWPYTKRETGVNALTDQGVSLLSLLEKFMSSALKTDVAKWLNQSWRIPSAVFVLDAAPQTKFSLSNKFSRNLGSMTKRSMHVYSNLRKHTIGFFVKSFGERRTNMVLTAGPSPGFSSRGAKNQEEPKPEGGPILKIQYWMYAATEGPNVKWGGTDFKWGGRAPLAPPLATDLIDSRLLLAVKGSSHLCTLCPGRLS